MQEKLLTVLTNSAPEESTEWLKTAVADLSGNFEKRPFYYAFSGVSRHFPKKGEIFFSEEDEKNLDRAVPGFSIRGWDQYRLARVVLLSAVLETLKQETFLETVAALLNTADLREQTAIFSAFPLLPFDEDLVDFAVDGLRTNIIDVFDSIALENPYPSQHFTDDAWNQMVLKALFLDRPLYRIYGIDYRANLKLAEMLSNLAHERWAAGRWVSPELWRSCANFLTDQIVEDLERVVTSEESGYREAVALIVAHDEEDRVAHLRDEVRTFLDDVEDGELTWDILGEQL